MADRRPPAGTPAGTLAQRWRGQRGRLEVWYATVSDPESGMGLWVHHELVSPVQGAPFVHGWAAAFRPGREPVVERYGRTPLPGGADSADGASGAGGADGWPQPAEAVLAPPVVRGEAGRLAWDLRCDAPGADDPSDDGGAPGTLFTFPRWAWEREVLPAAQVVPVASSAFAGTLLVDGTPLELSPLARGGVAHIYGHGNAQRWGWLHAELGGGDVLEVVAAIGRRPGLDRLPPLTLLQLRLGGRDWPRRPLLAAPMFRARLGLPAWHVRGTVGPWRLRVDVTLPAATAATVAYQDPDGAPATCTNSEVADADIVLEHRHRGWETVSAWTLRGRAHAEYGERP